MKNDNETPHLVSSATAAELLEVHTRTVRRWIEEEDLTPYRMGRTVRVDMNEVYRIMREGR